MNKFYLALKQRFARRTLARQSEMDILMLDRSQNAEYTRDGEEGSLAVLYDLIVNAILRLSPAEGKALDICCGSASLLCKVAGALPKMQFLGVDLSENMLQFAHENRERYGLTNLKFQQGDMYNLAAVTEPPYDLITWHLAMHHCTDAEAVGRVLRQIPQLLKPNGTLFVFDINRPKTGEIALQVADTFNRTQGDWFYQDSLDSYKAAFSFEEVEEILSKSELKNVHHLEPLIFNVFQVFYISHTDNAGTRGVQNIKQLWQKLDYLLLKTSFAALPLAASAHVALPKHSTLPSAPSKEDQQTIHPDIVSILDVGTRAMSAYNIQPWRFRIINDNIYIHCVRRKNFFLKLAGVYYMMIGHLLTNIMVGSRAKGYEADYEILSDALSVDVPCVRLKLMKTNPPDAHERDISPILNRRTNRYAYSTQKLDETVKMKILSLNDDANIEIRFLEDYDKDDFAVIMADLERVRLNNPRLALETIDFIRFGRAENEKHRDYLDVESLGLSPVAISFLKMIKKFPWLQRVGDKLGLVNRLYVRQLEMMQNSGVILQFILRRQNYRDFIKLGIVVQKIANYLAGQGIASMPVLSGLYLADVLNENPEILSNEAKNTVIHSFRKMKERFKIKDGRLAYILRAGYAQTIPPPTLRRNIQELIYTRGQAIEP